MSSMESRPTRNRSGKRCRSGCWTCRTRKIKCDELQPTCTTCKRLQLKCNYGVKLLWQEEAKSRGIALGRSGVWRRSRHRNVSVLDGHPHQGSEKHISRQGHHYVPLSTTEDWMFLNVTFQDFDDSLVETTPHDDYQQDRPMIPSPSAGIKPEMDDTISCDLSFAPACTEPHDLQTQYQWHNTEWTSSNNPIATFWGFMKDIEETSNAVAPGTPSSLCLSDSSISCPLPRAPSLFSLTITERFLLDYFENRIVRWCPGYGPKYIYRTIVMRLALGYGSPMLVSTILAASANQLRILNDLRFEKMAWVYRGKGLKLLQERIDDCSSRQDWSEWEDIFATVIMMCFFDVSDKCKSVWKSHLAFARSLRSWPQISSLKLSVDQSDLFNLFSSYFSSHEVLARTAAELDGSPDYASFWVPQGISMSDIDLSSGMSHELLSLISAISDLGVEKSQFTAGGFTGSHSAQTSMAWQTSFQVRRDEIERRLHCLKQKIGRRPWDTDQLIVSRKELGAVAEGKRLAALLYLYMRIDSATPQQSHMVRITARLLGLLPDIGVSTNTILWPLFIVGVMGVQNERDDDKKLVLQFFHDLQGTRQLGNVKRARRVVEEVWKRRELKGSDQFGWEELQTIVTRTDGEISLM